MELGEDDGIFGAEVIGREFVGLPDEPVTRFRQVLDYRHVFPVADGLLFQNGVPVVQQDLSVEVVEEAQVGKEGTGQERVTWGGCYLLLELLLTVLPSVLFTLQVQQQVL